MIIRKDAIAVTTPTLTIGGTRLPSKVGEYCYGMHNKIVRCPWHAYEFELETGISLAEPERLRVATYEIKREGDEVAIYV